ncbi:MAG: phosphoenolpyruvate--protein phosphotransferase, partial [Clostridia bacterium]|nr:phosphoenolpyruvate--protein phosphotransferase [Clostridia bacterium]
MVRLNGTGIAGGEAYGNLYFFRQTEALTEKKSLLGADRESERFWEASEKAAAELIALSEKCRAEMGDDAAALFETHAMLAGDADFAQAALRWINRGCTAEYAVGEAGREFAVMLEETGDEYLRERSADIRDVAARIVSILTGGGAVNELSEPVIIAADDLAPSQTVQLDRSKILGFILREGSKHGHT